MGFFMKIFIWEVIVCRSEPYKNVFLAAGAKTGLCGSFIKIGNIVGFLDNLWFLWLCGTGIHCPVD